jgi:vacuolar-type H+-ATPase subunit E/Vma4
MSVADIVRKIEQDAAREAAEMVRAAEQDAAKARGEATTEAESRTARALAQAKIAAEDDAQMRIAAARLAGRDRMLAEKRVMIERVLRQATEKLLASSDAEYAKLLAEEAASASRGSEEVLLAQADEGRLSDHLADALKAAGAEVRIGGTTPDIGHGIMLVGDRSRVEVSVAAMVAAKQEECEATISRALFGDGE